MIVKILNGRNPFNDKLSAFGNLSESSSRPLGRARLDTGDNLGSFQSGLAHNACYGDHIVNGPS